MFIKARIKVFLAYWTRNRKGKQMDVFGRTYRQTYQQFGNRVMAQEYLRSNTWHIK
jgi:hypothetical protein